MQDRHARYRRAELDPRRRPAGGFRVVDDARFERLVHDAVGGLPPDLLRYLDGVELRVQELPPDRAGSADHVELGRYVPGRRAVGRSRSSAADTLVLFQRPIEARARTKDELVELLRMTVVHELAHHYGIDDDRLDEFGWGGS